MRVMTDNRELYDYLVSLALELKIHGAISLSEAVDFASGQASSSSTEFVGESRIALRKVMDEENGILSARQRSDLTDVLSQIDAIFNNH